MKTNRSFFLLCSFIVLALTAHGQWVKQNGGLPAAWANGFAIDACSPTVAVISIATGTSPWFAAYLTKDAGVSFTSLNAPEIRWDISIVDSAHIWSVSDTCIYATSDGGATWQKQFVDTSVAFYMDYIRMFDLNNGVAVGDARAGKPMPILRTTDGGAHWTNTNTASLIGMVSGDEWRRIDFVSPSVGYIYTSGTGIVQGIYKTTDGGMNWSSVLPIKGIELLKFYNDQIGLAANGGYRFYRTTNGGASWDTLVDLNGAGWSNDIEFLPGNPACVWYTNYNKLFFSEDTGRTWTEQVITQSTLGGRDIVFTDPTHGWLLCGNGALYRTTNGDHLYVSVDVDKPEIPREFSLHQNYPNPFNPSTTIRFDVPRESRVRLEVFNLLGVRIAVIVDEVRQAGSYVQRFNAANLPSGVYFARLQAGRYTATKKLLLMW